MIQIQFSKSHLKALEIFFKMRCRRGLNYEQDPSYERKRAKKSHFAIVLQFVNTKFAISPAPVDGI